MSTSLYLRLSAIYLLFFAVIGVLVPYWALYLKHLGFGPAAIGELIAMTVATRLIAPNVWGWLADRLGRRMAVVRLGCLLAALSFSAIYLAGDRYMAVAGVLVLWSFFWNAALPQFEANALNHLGAGAQRYGRVRLWGSIGFIAMVVGLGAALESVPVTVVPGVLLALMAGLCAATLLVPEAPAGPPDPSPGGLLQVLRRPQVLNLFLVCILNQASHGAFYAFFSIYLEGLGYAKGLIGMLWALGVLAEIAVFVLMPHWLPRVGAYRLMLAAMGLAALRWVLTALFAQHLWVLVLAQSLHAFSFAAYHAVAIGLVHRFFVGANQGRGQALYSSLSFGVGGAAGSLAAGHLWSVQGPILTFLGAAAASLVGLAVAWRGLRGT